MAYNKDLDYEALKLQSAAAGDFAMAAALESVRNEKIKGEGLDYALTYDFEKYLGTEKYQPMGSTYGNDMDWTPVINNLMNSGASSNQVGSALQSRVNKATSTPGLGQYAYDDVYRQAQAYIAANKRDDTYDAVLDSLVNRKDFSYDPMIDPSYQALATQYTNQGKLTMQDTMGEFAALTGGMPSSAAISAGQQANNRFMSELSGNIPALEANAYGRYQGELANDLSVLGALQGAQDTEFAQAQKLLSMGFSNAKIAAQLGITEDQAQAYTAAVNTPKSSGKGGGSGGSSGTSAGGTDANASFYQNMYNSGIKTEGDTYAYLLAAGYNTTQAGKLAGYYTEWVKNQGAASAGSSARSSLNVITGATYSQAVQYLTSIGAPPNVANGIMTPDEWAKEGKPQGTYDAYIDSIASRYGG